MISFLFWNLNKRPLLDRVARMASAFEVDVLMLAECIIAPDAVLAKLNEVNQNRYSFPSSKGQRIRIFTRFPNEEVIDQFNDFPQRLTIRRILIGPEPGIMLAAVHFQSRVNWDRMDQAAESTDLARDILRTENLVGHQRTVLVGDLNMNPFDDGVIMAQGLHAMMTRDHAETGERTVAGRSYRFFYNPMWGLFGDRTQGPPGTHFFGGSKPVNCFWNIYDQVLLRPSLMHLLNDVRILDDDGNGTGNLLTINGRPDSSQGSDHLPVYFKLDL